MPSIALVNGLTSLVAHEPTELNYAPVEQKKARAGTVRWSTQGEHDSSQRVVSCTKRQWKKLLVDYPEMATWGILSLAGSQMVAISPLTYLGGFIGGPGLPLVQ